MPRISLTLLRVAFWAAALFSLTMAGLPPETVPPGPANDKVQHMIAFATLAGLASLAYPRVNTVTILVGLSAFGGAIELIQMIPAISRDASWWDWIADTVAAGLVLFFVHRLRTKRQAEAPDQA